MSECENMTILVTGGAGYIGSHTCVELINANYKVVVLDNLCNSNEKSLNRVELITGIRPDLIKGDIRDRECLQRVFKKYSISSVIHFAGLKSVGESNKEPLDYFNNNVFGSIVLFDEMKKAGIKKLVFSSSATVYGNAGDLPLTEDMPTAAINPYGRSKLMVEDICHDLYRADLINKEVSCWNIILLRYFNPVGAHKSGLIGEDPNGVPNNLMPYISQVAVGRLNELSIFGNDYSTLDGTGVRDYIHVVDLAKGHLKAIQAFDDSSAGVDVINLGTGVGVSVLQLISAFEKENEVLIPFKFVERRLGDIPVCYANVQKAKRFLNWEASLDVNHMVKDSWSWQSKNINGYD